MIDVVDYLLDRYYVAQNSFIRSYSDGVHICLNTPVPGGDSIVRPEDIIEMRSRGWWNEVPHRHADGRYAVIWTKNISAKMPEGYLDD